MEVFTRPTDRYHKMQWKLPLFFVIFLHLLILLVSFYAPDLFKAKTKFAQIQTVRIVSMPAPQPAAPETTKPASPPKPELQKVEKKTAPIKNTVPLAESPLQKAAAPEPASPKTISLNPKKTKVKKKIVEPEKPIPNVQKKQNVERDRAREEMQKLAAELRREAQREKQQAELDKQARLAAEKARLAKEALEEERTLLRNTPPTTAPVSSQTGGMGESTQVTNQPVGSVSNIIQQQYWATLVGTIQGNWAIPPTLENRSDLQATVVVTLTQNGRIIDSFFEKSSGNKIFDQFVQRSIDASNPLPPIPPAMGMQRIELGLNFSPKGVSSQTY